MNCRKYRAVLLGVIVMILVVGVCFYTKYRKENEIPTDGMLVYDNSEDEDCLLYTSRCVYETG